MKLTERIVLARLKRLPVASISLLNPHQSGFTKRHSTETLLVYLYNTLVFAVSHQQVSCLYLLDISAAFDTIEHSNLLQGLSSWFGVSGNALGLLWFQFYLFTRSFSVKACSHSSQPLFCGVPQGYVLGSPHFILYATSLNHLIESFSVDHHIYANDTPHSSYSSLRPLLGLNHLNISMDVIEPPLPQPYHNRIRHSRPPCQNRDSS